MIGATLPRPRLLYLDGIRGLACLYVLLFHAKLETLAAGALPRALGVSTGWLNCGHLAVGVFIVLSGFCLMLPVVRSGGTLAGGAGRYLLRRARRILPPYYAALAICLALLLVPRVAHWVHGTCWAMAASPGPTVGSVVAHLFVVHNFSDQWVLGIDGPMWSVAPEWDFYFLLPLLLLPAYRWLGVGGLLACGCAVGLALAPVNFELFDTTSAWYFAPFAMGCAAAAVAFSGSYPYLRQLLARPAAPAIAACAAVPLLFWVAHRGGVHESVGDLIVGPPVAILLAHLATRRRRTLLLNVLEHPALAWFGTVSYSLYLTHYPVLSLVSAATRGAPPAVVCGCVLGLAPVLSVGVAYLFHLAFERPFLPRQPKSAPTATLGGRRPLARAA